MNRSATWPSKVVIWVKTSSIFAVTTTLAVSVQCQLVMDRLADGRTDRHTMAPKHGVTIAPHDYYKYHVEN